MLNALIFDVDGTLADTENAHRAAFNHAFAEVGREWVWDEATYTKLLEVSGGKERILHYWKQVQPDLKDIDGGGVRDTVEHMHALKTAAYESAVQGGAVQLRPGVLALIESAHQAGLRLAIATTTSPVNIAALLRAALGAEWAQHFDVIEDASTAPIKKPLPQGGAEGGVGHHRHPQPLYCRPRLCRCAARTAQPGQHHGRRLAHLARRSTGHPLMPRRFLTPID